MTAEMGGFFEHPLSSAQLVDSQRLLARLGALQVSISRASQLVS